MSDAYNTDWGDDDPSDQYRGEINTPPIPRFKPALDSFDLRDDDRIRALIEQAKHNLAHPTRIERKSEVPSD